MRRFFAPFFESALTRTLILVFESFLTSRDVDLVSFAHVVEVEFVDITAHVLHFVNVVENSLVVSLKATSDLSGRLRSHLLDDIEHLFETKAMLAENVFVRSLK
jgi:hypothetical protein